MTTIIKTYSRERAAKAALVATITDIIDAETMVVTTFPVGEKFAARVLINGENYGEETRAAAAAALLKAGFEFEIVMPAPEEAPEPKAKAPGYIAEKSTRVGPTKRVWHIADAMKGQPRKAVIEACRAEGIAYGTARTQYQEWKKANGL